MTNKKEIHRCAWAASANPLMQEYHDCEWGLPVHDECKHFEFLILEGAQAGLSWKTILERREGYRKAYDGFDPAKVAAFGEKEIEKMLLNPAIIRNRLKITSSIENARLFLEIQKEFGTFDHYVWQFVGGKPIQNQWKNFKEVPAETEEAKVLSKDLMKRGFRFVGPTIIYAHMQAIGMVNDHTIDCFRYKQVQKQK